MEIDEGAGVVVMCHHIMHKRYSGRFWMLIVGWSLPSLDHETYDRRV